MADNFFAKFPVGPTAGVSSLNSLTGALTLAAGSNITLTPVGNTITIAASGGGITWATPVDSNITWSGTTDTLDIGTSLVYPRGFYVGTYGVNCTDGTDAAAAVYPGGIEARTDVSNAQFRMDLYEQADPDGATVFFGKLYTDGAYNASIDVLSDNKLWLRAASNISLIAGAASTIKLQKASVTNNIGDVWTATGTTGEGYWSVPTAPVLTKVSYNYTDFQDAGVTKTLTIALPAKTLVDFIWISIPTNSFEKTGGGAINLELTRSTGGTFYPTTDIISTVDEMFATGNAYDAAKVSAGGQGFENQYQVAIGYGLTSSNLEVTMSVTAGVLSSLTAGDIDIYYRTSPIP